MQCVYINLDTDTQRRANIESSFARHYRRNWNLNRFAAIDAEQVGRRNIAAELRPAQRGCILSHLEVIKRSMSHAEPIFILEDDAVFGSRTIDILDELLDQHCRNLDWDLLFTDIGVEGAPEMVKLLDFKRDLGTGEDVTLLDMKSIPSFFGSTAYILNPRAKQKIYSLFEAIDPLEREYDMYLRRFILSSQLKAYCTFPFVTTIAPEADSSSIQLASFENPELIMNKYRRLMWLEGNQEFLAYGDDWAADDECLQQAVCRLFGLERRPNAEELMKLAEQWRPWRGVAAFLLKDYYWQKAPSAQ